MQSSGVSHLQPRLSPMDQSRSSTPPSTAAESSAAVAADGGRPEHSAVSPVRRGFATFAASLQQGFGNFKALVVGQAQTMSARNEKESTEADLWTAKMQVEAADAAEDTKKRIENSN
ncbi:hypothetical protein RHGRI_021671 [Rhododendron griersonianum]|uniref:Uncharacterized protein n=1 Tax=Rhododendron griersonianum TaxID=479676 RepID=A0AAV6JR75_9ERIC|nr:hypothetical protein RHGRI_021671 [Rhododendron griersonianum]